MNGDHAPVGRTFPPTAIETVSDHAWQQITSALLLAFVHQPNPTDPTRWDIAPGKHREFSAFIAAIASRTRNTETVVKAEPVVTNRLRTIADNLDNRTFYHDPTRARLDIEYLRSALASPPSPAEVTEAQIRALVLKHFTQTRHRLTYEDEKDGISITRVSSDMQAFCRDLIALQLGKEGP